MPVAADRIVETVQHDREEIRCLVSVGHQAAQDRAGVRLVLDAARMFPRGVSITIRIQDRRLRHHPKSRHPRFTIEAGGVPDYWKMYADFDVLLHPRRYGGLSLPAGEACAAGLALAMTDCPPNTDTWPIEPIVGSFAGRPLRSQAGAIPVFIAKPQGIADATARLLNPEHRRMRQNQAINWAVDNDWSTLMPIWLDELTRAADRV